MNLTKICTVCKVEQPVDNFYTNGSKGLHSNCKSCKIKISVEYQKANRKRRNEYLKEWSRKNPEKRRAQKYRHRYGIDIKDYNTMLKNQNGRCKICNSNNPGRGKYFHVDHCHKTNNIRGLLCGNCNRGLGYFKDNIEVMQKAIEYLTIIL